VYSCFILNHGISGISLSILHVDDCLLNPLSMSDCMFIKLALTFYIDDFTTPVVERRTMNNSADTSNALTSHKYLQTVYVVDQYLLAYLGQSTLETLLPTVAHIVCFSFFFTCLS
jgi:hypothetical protein